MGNRLIGYGSYLPERIMTNADFEKVMDTSDEWITSRTGIKERHWARDDETVADMATIAAKNALDKAGITVDDLDLIICATGSAELHFPSVAVQVAGKLNQTKTMPGFDVNAACTGAVYAMHIARAFFESGMYKRIMVIGAEKLSRLIDMKDRNTAVLFGDGAGAMIFEATDSKEKDGLIDSIIMADGKATELLYVTPDKHIIMNGPEVYKKAVVCMPAAAEQIIKHSGITSDDIDWVIPHQANIRIIESAGERLGVPKEKVIATVDKHANTSAASGILAIAWGLDNGKVKKGDLVMYPAFGSGLTWGSVLLRV